MSKIKYNTVIISDCHLGSRGSQAKKLFEFLDSFSTKRLILNGDIIDGWRLKKDFYFPQSHLDVIRKIMKMAKKGTEVIYVTGNHDEFLRNITDMNVEFSNIKIVDKYELNILDKKYLVVHGDNFDLIMQNYKWLAFIGDSLYTILIKLNRFINWFRNKTNMKGWSLSKYIKRKVKSASNYIGKYEVILADYAKKNNYDGVICGHIHKPENKVIDGIHYLNSGDWVETCSAIIIDDEFICSIYEI